MKWISMCNSIGEQIIVEMLTGKRFNVEKLTLLTLQLYCMYTVYLQR
jgi:hypothetical protein